MDILVFLVGLSAVLVGLVSLVKPLRFLRIRSRKVGGVVLGAGFLVAMIGALLVSPSEPTDVAGDATVQATTTTTQPMTASLPPAFPETLALGTIQVVLVSLGESVVLPAGPMEISMTLTRSGSETRYEFEDPDSGRVYDEQGTFSLTVSTFAVPLEPGVYQIERLELSEPNLAADGPVSVPTSFFSGVGDDDLLVGPFFTVTDDASCTFVGELTFFYWRTSPGDTIEDAAQLLQEVAPPESGLTGTYVPEGSIFLDRGALSGLDGILEGDFSGHSWWLAGEQVDESQCVTELAEFRELG